MERHKLGKMTIPDLRGLEVGESKDFSSEYLCSIRAICSSYGVQWDREFTTRLDRRSHSVTVTRRR